MKRSELSRTVNEPLISQVDDDVTDDNFQEIDLQKASASCYERLRKYRIKSQKEDIIIVVGLYLILINVAIVVL